MKKKILILEDNLEIREVFGDYLGGSFNVKLVSLPSEAIAFLTSEAVDLIITDFNLPEMNGISFINKARKELNVQCPILLISAQLIMIQETIPESVESLEKPFALPELKMKIEKMC